MDLQRALARATRPWPARPVLVAAAEPDAAQAFFEQRMPEAVVLLDPQLDAFRAVGLVNEQPGLPPVRAAFAAVRALARGHRQTQPVDQRVQPGFFLVRGAEVVLAEPFPHPGHKVDLETLPWRLENLLRN